MNDTPTRPVEANPAVKLVIDVGPLIVFFLAYYKAGIFWATGVLMAATVVALIASRVLLGRFSVAPAVTAVLVVVFGALTFFLDDPSFIKMKPTIINLLFAGVLGFGIYTGRPLLKMFMGEALRLTDEGWHRMTVRWTRILRGDGGAQRDRLAQLLRGGLGQLQGVRHPAVDVPVRHGPGRTDQASRGQGRRLKLAAAALERTAHAERESFTACVADGLWPHPIPAHGLVEHQRWIRRCGQPVVTGKLRLELAW